MEDLVSFRRDTYSQLGEDGIITRIFDSIGHKNSWCCEIGAWDGVHLSNTRNLVEQGWSAILIEADKNKASDLVKNCSKYPNVKAVCSKVSTKNKIDDILRHSGAPKDMDLMSIDIDGDEYVVWESMEDFRPRLMVIETNYTFPPNVEFVQNTGLRIGSSPLSMTLLAKNKGYELVCFNVINCFFVRSDALPVNGIHNRSFLENIYIGSTLQMGLHSSYDGERFMSGEMSWGSAQVHEPIGISKVAKKFKIHLGIEWIKLMEKLSCQRSA